MTPRFTGVYLLDASALLAYAGNESGAHRVEHLLRTAQKGECRLLISSLSIQEACSEVWFKEGEEAARLFYGRLARLPLQTVGVDDQLLWLACEIRTTRPLCATDSWILATAKRYQATLVHKDPSLDQLPKFVPLLPLHKNGSP